MSVPIRDVDEQVVNELCCIIGKRLNTNKLTNTGMPMYKYMQLVPEYNYSTSNRKHVVIVGKVLAKLNGYRVKDIKGHTQWVVPANDAT